MFPLKAIIFDLDGVLTDTAEYHYQAWKKLADEEGLPFTRAHNEKLRGVSRRDSLLLILGERQVNEGTLQAMMARKNAYYRQMLTQISANDLLPGAACLLDELDRVGLPYALASASRNAPEVIERLGIAHRFAAVADGSSVPRQKPAPDLFRYAAACLNVPPDCCLVVEDAAAGIVAARTAGMSALAIGPAERFAHLVAANGRFSRRGDLQNLTVAELQERHRPAAGWMVTQTAFEAETQRHMETVFTLGSGYVASRGSLEEGYPGEHRLTLAHGVFDDMPVSFTELVNLPDWLDLAVVVDERPFRLDQGQVLYFHRYLNLREGLLRREVRWQSPDGVVVDVSLERFVSYAHEQVAGMRLLITAVNQPCHVTVHTGINGHVANDDLLHWHLLGQGEGEDGMLWLQARTRHTGIELGVAVKVDSWGETAVACQQCPGQPRYTLSQQVPLGQTVQVDKLISYTTSRDVTAQEADVISRAQQALQGHHYEALRHSQQEAWSRLWQDCDVVIEGDEEAQLAIRFNLFQLLIAASQQDEHVSIGAKTLSGLGYRGHVFWDTEIFILPFFMYTRPQLARNMLMYRYHTLAGARQKAAANGYDGAQYAWESAATGEEVTPTWVPHFSDRTKLVRIWTGDIQIHISADVAYAVMHYWRVTGDDAFLRTYGAEIILDTARFWGSRAEREEGEDGQYVYAFRDVIGPDEYHDHVDNNSFTNYMACWHLRTALDVLAWLQEYDPNQALYLTDKLQISDVVCAHWQDVIEHTLFLYDPETGLIDQFENFFDLEVVSPEFIRQAEQSLQVVFGIEGANERQVLKQADVIMLLCLFRDNFDVQTWRTNWDVYMPKTDHRYGSSLGPSFHAWAACEMDRPEEAYHHFMLAAQADLRNPRGNAGDGIHAASAGGLWQALAFGFAGLRLSDEGYTTAPKLPAHWQRLSFKFYHHGEQYVVDVGQGALV